MRVNYVAPSDKAIEAMAQSICKELGQQNPLFRPSEIWRGLAEHLKIVMAIRVRIANARQAEQHTQTEQLQAA